jgi:hypothetical protein
MDQLMDKKEKIDQELSIQQTAHRLFGFIPNTSRTVYEGCIRILGETSPHHLLQPTNTAFHNLCLSTTLPKGIAQLLGLGLKFCIEPPRPQGQKRTLIETSLPRFQKSIRLHFMFKNHPEVPDTYIPRLYIPSPWEPSRMLNQDNVESALVSMETLLLKKVHNYPDAVDIT